MKANLEWLRKYCSQIVLVNCAGKSSWLRANCRSLAGIDISILELPVKAFNKSLAINVGLAIAEADLILILDVDVILRDFLQKAVPLCDGKSCVTLRQVRESNFTSSEPSELRQVTFTLTLQGSGATSAVIETGRIDLAAGTRSAPGILLTDKRNLLNVGGLNSELAGWGWEDIDLLARLQFKCGLRHHQTGFGTHLSHGDDVRQLGGLSSRVESEQRNSQLCLSQYQAGKFDGTLETDILTWRHCLNAWSV